MVDYAMYTGEDGGNRPLAADIRSAAGTVNGSENMERFFDKFKGSRSEISMHPAHNDPYGWERQLPQNRLLLPEKDAEPSEDLLILCDCLVWGFSFRTKRWRQYHVDHLIEVDFRKKSFDRLVLREDYKTILKAMVAQHLTKGQDRFQDLVVGKGQGLNVLLHGGLTDPRTEVSTKQFQAHRELAKH